MLKPRAPFILHFGSWLVFTPRVAVAEAVSLACLDRCHQGLAVFWGPPVLPSFLLLSQHLGGLKPASCNCSNKHLLFPKGFLPALCVT